MARAITIPPKPTLVVAMPPVLLRALLISKAVLQDRHHDATGSTDPNVGRYWYVADGLQAVNIVLGYPHDEQISRGYLLKRAKA